MGLYLYCRKTKKGLDMSTGGFNRFRSKVAGRVSPEFSEHYEQLSHAYDWTDDQFEAYDQKTMEFVNNGVINIKVADFLYKSDLGGFIRYGACSEILKLIDDYDDNEIYGYAGRPNPIRIADIKALLHSCIDNKCELVWDN